MEIVKFKREQEQHIQHIRRIRNIDPVLDTSTPESLGLKHLALRPKKMQLVEDRRQTIAKENAKLMTLMTNIMNEKRKPPKYTRPASLNELERKREIDRINFENKLMIERLSHTRGVINNESLKESFAKHQKAEQNLRRRQMKPLSLPRDFHSNSPLHRRESGFNPGESSYSSFDASFYTTQRHEYLEQGNLKKIQTVPIHTVADFRKHVISTKKLQHYPVLPEPSGTSIQESTKSLERKNLGDGLYEISHVPY